MVCPFASRLRDLLAVTLVLLAASPFTAPFSTYDLGDRHGDSVTHQAEILAAKLSAGEDLAVVGAPSGAGTGSSVFVLVSGTVVVDETSKRQIPSRILRL
jgi:hypothetical protein